MIINKFSTPPANDGSRIIAVLIDSLLAGALSIVPYVGWIAGVAYILIRDGLPFLEGQSVGKKLMGLRAVTEDGLPLTNNWSANILRNLILLAVVVGSLIELIVMLTNQDRQRLGDQWAKTRVIAV